MTGVSVETIQDRLPPCGRRGKRGIPCKLPAGWGTDHVGQGRCKLHGGTSRIKHGRYSTILRPAIKQRLDELERLDQHPLVLRPELKLLRALVIDFIERKMLLSDPHTSLTCRTPHAPSAVLPGWSKSSTTCSSNTLSLWTPSNASWRKGCCPLRSMSLTCRSSPLLSATGARSAWSRDLQPRGDLQNSAASTGAHVRDRGPLNCS
jgi:hypothetical protein